MADDPFPPGGSWGIDPASRGPFFPPVPLPPPPPPGSAWSAPPPPIPPRTKWARGRAVPLTPMGVGEMLDAAVNLYRLHWRTLMAIVAFVIVPITFVQEALLAGVTGTTVGFGQPTTVSQGSLDAYFAIAGPFALVQFLIVRPFLTAAIVRAVAAAYQGEGSEVGAVYAFALRRLGSILWVLVLTTLALIGILVAALGFTALFAAIHAWPLAIPVFLGAVVLIVVVYVRWQFGPAVVVVEGGRGTAALRRSWGLISRAFWKVLGTELLAGLLVSIASTVLAVIPTLLSGGMGYWGWVVRAVGAAAASVVTTPFATIVLVLLYFDQRIRKEGLDLSIMAQELRSPAAS